MPSSTAQKWMLMLRRQLQRKKGSLGQLKAGIQGAKLGILTKEGIHQVFSKLGLSETHHGDDGVVDYTRKMNLAKKVHIFRPLAPDQLASLVKSFVVQKYVKGAQVIKQGEMGTSFFVIAHGEVTITIDGKLT